MRFLASQWPPPQDTVVKWGPLVLAGLAGPISVLAVSSFRVRLSAEELASRTAEARRRIKRTQEILDMLEKIEVPNNDILGQISYDFISSRCMELFPLGYGSSTLSAGVDWCARLMIKELRIGTWKTEAQTDTDYSDGSKLDSLLTGGMTRLSYLTSESGHKLPNDVEAALRAETKRASSALAAVKRKDLGKAVNLLLLVRGAWPWIAATGMVSVSLSSLSTLTMHYRVEVLETFRQAAFSRECFMRAAGAMTVVELSATLLRVLEFQLTDLGHGIAGRMLQVELYKALMKKDLQWWEIQKDPRKIMSQLFGLAQEVSAFLDIPLEWLKRCVTIVTQAALVRQSSSNLLYLMLGFHGINFLGRKFLSKSHEWLCRASTRSVLLPSESSLTWTLALEPQNVALYQSFVRDEREAASFSHYLDAISGYGNKKEIVQELLNPVNSALSQGTNIAQILSTGRLVQQGIVRFSQLESLMQCSAKISQDVEKTWEQRNKFQAKSTALAKAYDLISIPPSINPDVGDVPNDIAKGLIVFKDVCFEYPHRKALVLKGLTFQAEPGQVVGMTGPAGCGKTTALSLIERMYDVTSGCIMLDGRDIREYSPHWLRRQIAIVSQEPQLLRMSIRENIIFGCRHDPSLEEIRDACVAANIWDALADSSRFPEGLETNIMFLKNMSGGEKQRICIARAILANRPILLLDEATSALDEASQIKVQEALEQLMRGRTTITVAHRLSTIRKADKILAMENGTVAEEGHHEQLLQNPSGLYRRLWHQSKGEVGGSTTAAS